MEILCFSVVFSDVSSMGALPLGDSAKKMAVWSTPKQLG
jgi:hypothetical protein